MTHGDALLSPREIENLRRSGHSLGFPDSSYGVALSIGFAEGLRVGTASMKQKR